MNKNIIGLDIIAKGVRKEEQPTGFKTISIILNLKSKDINIHDMDKVIKLSKESFCPVWSMLKGSVEMEVKYILVS